jgi:hypothetical protein
MEVPMKFVAIIIFAGMLAIVAAVAPVTVNFDNVPAGQPPAGWTLRRPEPARPNGRLNVTTRRRRFEDFSYGEK